MCDAGKTSFGGFGFGEGGREGESLNGWVGDMSFEFTGGGSDFMGDDSSGQDSGRITMMKRVVFFDFTVYERNEIVD